MTLSELRAAIHSAVINHEGEETEDIVEAVIRSIENKCDVDILNDEEDEQDEDE